MKGTPLTQRSRLNFVGADVTVTDDPGNDTTLITITSVSSIAGSIVFEDLTSQIPPSGGIFTLAQPMESGTLQVYLNGLLQRPSDYSELTTTTFSTSLSPTSGDELIATYSISGGGSGASTFLELTDTPSGYAGQTGKVIVVNGAEDGLEFTTISGGGGATALDDLTDVVITSPVDGDSLSYDGGSGTWINASGGGGGSTVYPRHVTLWPGAYTSIGQGSWSINTNSSSVFSSYYAFGGSASNGDNVSYTVDLDAGTYGFNLVHHRNTSAGIMKIDIDGVEVGSIDLYSGLTWNVTTEITGISISTAGQHTLRFRMDGKNGSSSGYNGYCVIAGIYRTD